MHEYQIPGQLTHFVGRSRERTEIVGKLKDPNCRLLTLVGPGGIGKTSLSLKIARNELGNFEHGVRFVRLQSVAASERIALAITDELDLPLKGAQEPKQILLDYFRGKAILLIQDNYEHLIDSQGLNLITEILDMT